MTKSKASPPPKPPRVKKGYGSRSPDAVIDERIAEAAAVLALKPSIHRSELHKYLRPRWLAPSGDPVHWRTVDRIVVRAKKALAERSKRPKDSWIDDILAGYDRDIGDADPKVRLAARLGIRDMLGLDAPRRTELTGADGQPLKVEDVTSAPKLSKSRLRELIGLAEVIGNGHVIGNGNGSPQDQTTDTKRA